MHIRRIELFLPFPLAAVVVVSDQLLKRAVVSVIGPNAPDHERWLVGDWIGLRYAQNTGVAFGLLGGRSVLLISILSLVTLVFVVLFIWRYRSNFWMLFAGGLIGGGAVGNLVDRVRLGYVRDFVTVGPWPPFNLADSAITIGVVVAIWFGIRPDRHHAKGRNDNRLEGKHSILDTCNDAT